ncbi:MAG: flagellar biosynthetic protein FliO [Chlamydiia bacterium]
MDIVEQDLTGQLAYLFLVLILLLGGAVIALYLIRRFLRHRWNPTAGARSIEVLERTQVSPKTTLFLIEVEGRRLLIAESSDEVCPIADLARFKLEMPPKPPAV